MLSVIALMLIMAPSALATEQVTREDCGWLVQVGGELRLQPDGSLRPSDPRPLPTPPQSAKAAYCIRESMITNVSDERVIRLGLPLVIRSGEREGVLEVPPRVQFDYRRDGNRYLPGRPNTTGG
jgi:hypothetical protein